MDIRYPYFSVLYSIYAVYNGAQKLEDVASMDRRTANVSQIIQHYNRLILDKKVSNSFCLPQTLLFMLALLIQVNNYPFCHF